MKVYGKEWLGRLKQKDFYQKKKKHKKLKKFKKVLNKLIHKEEQKEPDPKEKIIIQFNFEEEDFEQKTENLNVVSEVDQNYLFKKFNDYNEFNDFLPKGISDIRENSFFNCILHILFFYPRFSFCIVKFRLDKHKLEQFNEQIENLEIFKEQLDDIKRENFEFEFSHENKKKLKHLQGK
jgi:hypothetical protein